MEGKFDWISALNSVKEEASDLELRIVELELPPYAILECMRPEYTFKAILSGAIQLGVYVTPEIIAINTSTDNSDMLVKFSMSEAYRAKDMQEKLQITLAGILFVHEDVFKDKRYERVYGLIEQLGIPIRRLDERERGEYADRYIALRKLGFTERFIQAVMTNPLLLADLLINMNYKNLNYKDFP